MGAVETYLLDKKVKLLQPEKGFRTGIDTVLAAAACPAGPGQRVLDMGCGVGGISFCLLHRVPEAKVTGVDIQDDYIRLAQKNTAINGPGYDIHFVSCDIRQYSAASPESRFDHVVSNPPFLEAGQHIPSPEEGKARARGHDVSGFDIKDWIDAGFRNLKSGGSLTIIHRADALDRIIQALGRRFGAVEIIPLWPRAGVAAKRVIVRALKDRKSPATLHAGLVLHEADGSYTTGAEAVLRRGVTL